MEFPASFGRYQLLQRIATGGMAEVFLARSFGVEGFEKRLVIKRILPELASNPRFVSMFIHEAKLSVCLSHPNVVQVFDLGKTGNDLYIAMEYIRGRDLTHVLRALRRDGRRMPIPIAASVAASVARGLAYAHARTGADGRPLHIVHRDVSPHNIVVSFEGEVKLVDFGIARLAGDGSAATAGGKYAYMSPEQAAGRPTDARSDTFSLGVVLCEALAGRKLYADMEAEDKLRAVMACDHPPIAVLLPDAPPELRRVVERALHPDPDDRYPSAAVMEDDLRAFLFDAGFRGDTAQRAAWLRALFPDAARDDDAAGSALEQLVEDLQVFHGEPPAEAPGTTTPADGAHGTGDPPTEERSFRPAMLRGERRHVVVLVAEVNGFTEVSAGAESEELARIHYRLLRSIRGVVDRMGGVAESFTDDTLVVFFGLPRALGDDLDRALACARELHRLGGRLRKRGIACEFAVGVHVGELTLSPAGRRYRYAARGDTVKAAVRLAYAAEPGNTLVSDRVAALAGDRFPFDRGPELRRKGARGGRPTFVLAGGRRAVGRGAAGRWFRRGDEADVLRAAIGALREGTGARLAVTGEAGIGKTRLFRELRDLCARRGLPVYHGRGVPGGAERPLSPFRDLVSDILGIHPDTDPAGLRERLERLRQLDLEPSDIAIIASLYAMDLGETPPERGRDALFAAGARLVRGLAVDGPVVVMLEDLQYLDPFERDLFEHLLRAADGQRIVVLTSWRREVPAPFDRMLLEVRLGPLSPSQTGQMAADLLGARGIGPDLTRLVNRCTEGNPLYLEEVIKALHQAGRIYYEGTLARLRDPQVDPGLPPTLQGLLAARVDQLEPGPRGALQVAAVLGPGFSPALLAAAIGADDPAALIGELVRAGLIVPESRSPETGYEFASVLVWECVLRGILGIQRREFHRMVASGMERLYAGRLEVVAESWASHCHAGGRLRDAAAGMLRAGNAHRNAQFLERAHDCYERGVSWLRAAPRDQQDNDLEARLNLASGELGALLGRPRAEAALQAALDIASESGPADVEARALLALGQHYAAQGKAALARAHLEAAVPAMRRGGDVDGQVRCLECLGGMALDEGRVDQARAIYEEGLSVAGADTALAARMLVGLAAHALRRDDSERAKALLNQALPKAEEAADRILVGRIVNNLGIAHFNEGRFDAAVADFRRALEVRQGLGYRHGEVVNLHNIGDALLRMGDRARAWASFEASRDLAREAGWDRGVVMNDVYLCYLRGLGGEPAEAELDAATRRAARLGDHETAIIGRSFLAKLMGPAGERLLKQAQAEAKAAGLDGLARQMGG